MVAILVISAIIIPHNKMSSEKFSIKNISISDEKS